MEELKEAVTGWSAWFRRTLVGVIVFLLGTGGMAVWQYASLNVHVGVVEREMEKVAKRNERLDSSVDQLEKKLEMIRAFLQAPKPVYKSQDGNPTGE